MGKENNKTNVEFTEIELKKLINYIIHYDITDENNGYKSAILKEIFTNESYNNNAWWAIKKKDKEIYYDQKAHIVMRILAKSNKINIANLIGKVQNNGFCCLLHYCINNSDYNEKSDKKQTLSAWWLNYEKDIKKFLEHQKNIEQEISINILLDYLKLYFSYINNFNSKNDFKTYNKPILDNLYDWYLKDVSQDKIQKCCNKLEEIVSGMETMLNNNSNNSIKKLNLICTICYTKIKINNLMKEENTAKNIANNYNNFLEKIIDSLEITDQVTIK